MSGKLFLIGVILQLARAVRVAGGDYGNGSFSATDRNSKSMNSEHNTADNCSIKDCAQCSSETIPGTEEVRTICAECNGNKKLSPLKDACLADCPYGSYETTTTPDSTRVCVPCHPSCARCNNNAGAAFCISCYPGFVLSHPNGPFGICIPECTEEFGANCEAGYCTADIVDSKYCSKCKSGYVLVDGVCVPVTQRTIQGCGPSAGICTACPGNDYVLLSNGCYNTLTFPGKSVCTAATGGKCTDCVNGQTADNSGSCPSCPDGCDLCDKSNTETCEGCFPGYYLSGTKCIKCDISNKSITGVKNCMSCASPDNSQGSVICYVIQPGVSPTDPSVNKGGSSFSTGAIAGISIVIILIIGGLAGFLCWWFICHKKK